ncbi:MAG: hypothetical protein WBA20_22100 [Ketobacter sp.]
MKRLYYLFQGTAPAKTITDDLKLAGINSGQLHFMSRDVSGLTSAKVHNTGILDEKDISHSGTYGAIIGLGLGIILGFYLMTTDLAQSISFVVFLVLCVFFTCLGTWAGAFIGMSMDNHHIARFHDALDQGETLLMLDTYDINEEKTFRQLMHQKHEEAHYEGEEDNFKVFL